MATNDPMPMDFSAEVYKAAAAEHIVVAAELYKGGHHTMAIYVAGLAIESLFRAYRFRYDPVFDARHDLLRLYKLSKIERALPPDRVAELYALFMTIAILWSNSHRYRSEHAMRAYIKRVKLDRSVRRGDFLKELARRSVHAATELVTVGVRRWQT